MLSFVLKVVSTICQGERDVPNGHNPVREEELVVMEMGFYDSRSKSRLSTRVSLSHH